MQNMRLTQNICSTYHAQQVEDGQARHSDDIVIYQPDTNFLRQAQSLLLAQLQK